jgi:hypothetical protein
VQGLPSIIFLHSIGIVSKDRDRKNVKLIIYPFNAKDENVWTFILLSFTCFDFVATINNGSYMVLSVAVSSKRL